VLVDVVQILEQRFLKRFRDYAAQLEIDFVHVRATARSYSVGSLTPFQGHTISLECFFPDASPEESDNVAICIGVKHLKTEPMLCNASVEWGEHGGTELDLLEEPLPCSPEAIETIEAAVPQLFDALRTAIARRCEQR
jgi:hypothetical protein